MKKILYATVTFSLLFCNLNAITLLSNSPRAKKALATLEKLNEYKLLIQEIEKEGPIKIELLNLDQEKFDAFWDSSTRTVRINLEKNKDFNVLVCSILFELHNAKSDKRFKQLYTGAKLGTISKENYVEGVERMEHQNALNCSLLLEKGIRLGIFSPGARWNILRNFDDHYKLQQIREHSYWLARSYDSMAPSGKKGHYIGTLPKLSNEDKEDMVRYLQIKNDLESTSNELASKGLINLEKEYKHLRGCSYNAAGSNCIRTNERIKLLQLVFKDNNTYKTLIHDSPLRHAAR